ncbi:MAG: hypothetical protein J0I04_11415 [Paenarthrobacter ureafaciens]|uniref:DODA-type extradiol aromatic ring-opening family dioxygenase n=1 Tax=Paenarthrobacter ureafaciens TaxID=37931 RepID=UPI001AD458EF|nr:hypothetical protein [Paenarthrobacter ureafaciens]MBN9130238.1 hypothetical protein [Paenarthrobacter ureafaciens]
MAKIVGYIAMSHSPFWDGSFDVEGPGSAFAAGAGKMKETVEALNPDLVVIFGPDHFRNFFFDLMPAYCIGTGEIESFGDYGGYKGPLPFRNGAGLEIIEAVREAGFDPAFSLRMGVDHGISQPYEVLVPDMNIPVVPVMVDCSAPPRPTLRRSYSFGKAVGDAIRAMDDDLKVLILASGGLSHWVRPMSPYDEATDHETREFLIDGRDQVVEYNKAREENLAQRIANHHEGKINEEWDRWFLDRLAGGPLEDLLSIDPDQMEEVAGNGAHEVASWIAGLGAWGGDVATVAYEPVPRWVTGMGLAAGFAEVEAAPALQASAAGAVTGNQP